MTNSFKTFDNIPKYIKDFKQFLVWQYKPNPKNPNKPSKVPSYVNGQLRTGTQGSAEDVAQLATFKDAVKACAAGGYSGIGLALLPNNDSPIVALDFDDVVTDGQIDSRVEELCIGTYTEFSPSGRGIRSFRSGDLQSNHDSRPVGDRFKVEFFGHNGYVTITGDVTPECQLFGYDNTVAPVTPEVKELYRQRFGEPVASASAATDHSLAPSPRQSMTIDQLNAVLQHLDPGSDRASWLRVAMACHHEFEGSAQALDAFDAWSKGGDNYAGRRDVANVWKSLKRDGYTMAMLINSHESLSDFRERQLIDDFEVLPALPEPDPIDQVLMQRPTQDNVALIFARQFGSRLLYAHKFKRWYRWDGRRWCREETKLAFDFARALSRKVNNKGKSAPASSGFCSGVETFAQADRAFAITGEEFDSDNYLLNTPAGTFDLRTNTLRPHDPGDRLTHCTMVAPSPTGGQRFLKFLDEITGNDPALIKFLQVSLGSCLSGAIESHWLLFWSGSGRNGKNTLGDVVAWVMGGYAKKIPAATLMAKQHEGHPTELASLKGVRLAVASEVPSGSRWNEARINELTGDPVISARFMNADFFEFERTHKHLIYGNHRPRLDAVTPALQARIKIVPFRQSFIGREDALLPVALKQEASFILNWLLQGHADWIAAGRKLPECDAVAGESADYFSCQSTVENWIAEQIQEVKDEGQGGRSWPRSSDLFAAYQGWKLQRGEVPVSIGRWADAMSRKFPKVVADGVRYRGARLATSASLADVSDLF